MHILGVNLRDGYRTRYALTKFYGVGQHIAHRLCARLQVHDNCKVKDLTPFQVTALASFLSSPATSPTLPHYPLADPDFVPPPLSTPLQTLQANFNAVRLEREQRRKERLITSGRKGYEDPLKKIKVEADLKREIRENIAHQRMIGSYVGRRHAMHLPVRGQNTQNNARTARKLNQLGRFSS